MVSPVFNSPLHIEFYLLTSVKSSHCVSWNPGNFGYSGVVQVQGRFHGIQQKNSIIYYPELTATVKIPYIKKSTGFQGIPLDSYIPARFQSE